jgi:hypothetical protein
VASISELAVRISADMKDFESKMGGFSSQLNQMGKTVTKAGSTMTKSITLPAIAAGVAIAGLMVKYGNLADEVLDAAAITGLSTDEMQRWRKLAVDAGVDLDIVTNSVQRFNKQIERGNDISPRLAKGFDTMGMSAEEFKKLEPDQQMREIAQTMMELEEADARAFANQMNMAELLPIISEMQAQGKDLDEIMAEIDVPFDQEHLEQMNEFRKEWDNLKESIFILIGKALKPLFEWFSENKEMIQAQLVPALEGLIEKITGVFEWFAKLSPETRKIIGVIVGLAVAMGPILIVAGKVITLLPVLAKIFGVLLGPVGLIIAAIGGLVALFVHMMNTNEEFRNRVLEVFERVKEFISNAIETVKNVITMALQFIMEFWDEWGETIIEYVTTVFMNVVDFISNAIETAKEVITTILNFIMEFWDEWGEDIIGFVTSTFQSVWTIIKQIIELVSVIIGSALENIKEFWERWGSTITYIWLLLWDGIKNAAQTAWELLKGVIEGALQIISGVLDVFIGLFTGDWQRMWDGLGGIVKGAGNVIISIVNAVLGAIERMINGTSRAVNRIPRIKIPSWVPGIGGNSFGIPRIPTVALPRVPKLETGTNFVPQDMLAMIHKGEAVVPKKYNQTQGGIIININGPISSEKDADYFANAMVKKLRLAGVNI